MKYTELANAGVDQQPIYEPGRPIEDVARDFGLDPAHIAKLASNENPFGPSPLALEAARSALQKAHLYPDGACTRLRLAIAKERGISPESILVGNGSNEIIELLGHAFLRPGLEAVMGAQAFVVYKLVSLLFGAKPVEVPMKSFGHDLRAMRSAVTDRTRLVFVASPNNPTGVANAEAELVELAESLPDHVIMVLDEAYAEYLERAPDLRSQISAGCQVFCLRTFSKIYGLGGLRVGYGYGDPELVQVLQRVRQPFNVGLIGQAAATAALEDKEFVAQCQAANEKGRAQLVRGLEAMGIPVVGGSANFVMAEVGEGKAFFEQLQSQGVIVRPLGGYGMPEFVRVTIGTEVENERFLRATSCARATMVGCEGGRI